MAFPPSLELKKRREHLWIPLAGSGPWDTPLQRRLILVRRALQRRLVLVRRAEQEKRQWSDIVHLETITVDDFTGAVPQVERTEPFRCGRAGLTNLRLRKALRDQGLRARDVTFMWRLAPRDLQAILDSGIITEHEAFAHAPGTALEDWRQSVALSRPDAGDLHADAQDPRFVELGPYEELTTEEGPRAGHREGPMRISIRAAESDETWTLTVSETARGTGEIHGGSRLLEGSWALASALATLGVRACDFSLRSVPKPDEPNRHARVLREALAQSPHRDDSEFVAFVRELARGSQEEVAALLHTRGKQLAGKNLKRQTWSLVARGLEKPRVAGTIAWTLHRASKREHGLRAMRLAKSAGVRDTPRAGRKRQRPSVGAVHKEVFARHEDPGIDPMETHECWVGCSYCGRYHGLFGDPRPPELIDDPLSARCPGVAPTSRTANIIDHALASFWRPVDRSLMAVASTVELEAKGLVLPLAEWLPTDMRSVIDSNPGSPLALWLCERRDTAPTQIATVADAALLALLDRDRVFDLALFAYYQGLDWGEVEIDWRSIITELVGRARESEEPKEIAELTFAAVTIGRCCAESAAVELAKRVSALPTRWHGLATVAVWHHPDDPRSSPYSGPPWWAPDDSGLRPHPSPERWTAPAHRGFGSVLTTHVMMASFEEPVPVPTDTPADAEYWRRVFAVVTAGGRRGWASTRRQDYPPWRLETSRRRWAHKLDLGELSSFCAAVTSELAISPPQGTGFPWLRDRLEPVVYERIYEGVVAYVLLTREVLASDEGFPAFRIRNRHTRRFWAENAGMARPFLTDEGPFELSTRFGLDALVEGIVHACLANLRTSWPGAAADDAETESRLVQVLRTASLAYGGPVAPRYLLPGAQLNPNSERLDESARRILDQLWLRFMSAPTEVSGRLCLPAGQGLPTLPGGQPTALELRFRRFTNKLSKARCGGGREEVAEAKVFDLRPLSKHAALDRGRLGADCSSVYLPYRALSPHHTYYGVFRDGVVVRGYIGVFEAWAVADEGSRFPVLCLETVNVPIDDFDGMHEDIVVLLEGVAQSRGLFPGLVLVHGSGTWNHWNERDHLASPRFKQGTKVTLAPADPVVWHAYASHLAENEVYSPFEPRPEDYAPVAGHRLLAPLEDVSVRIESENRAEAARLISLGPRKLIPTAWDDGGDVIGFISELPDVAD